MKYLPLSHRALRWIGRRGFFCPAMIGVAASVSLGGLAMWVVWYTGVVGEVAADRAPAIAVRAPVTLYMMIGYLPIAIFYLIEWTEAHLHAVAQDFPESKDELRLPRRSLAIGGVLGSLGAYLAFLYSPQRPLLLFEPERWEGIYPFALIGLIVMGWLTVRFIILIVWCALQVSRAARAIADIDLLDDTPLKPFSQQGVRSSLLAVIGISISANLWLDSNAPLVGTAAMLVLFVVTAALALFVPTWGIHKRLQAAKRVELERVRQAIALRRDPMKRTVEDAQQLRADLALERRLMEVSEWPFDAGSYTRVVLYMLLGLGSWVGAAVVERMLESLGSL